MNGFVYFAQGVSGGPIKIGFSREPVVRLRSLQTTSPERLRLIGMVPGTELDEKRIHAALVDHRLHGEWFSDHGDVRRVFAPSIPRQRQQRLEAVDFWREATDIVLELRDLTTVALDAIQRQDCPRFIQLLEEAAPALRARAAALVLEPAA